jgi:CPA1 family monovalent cation:H+ antiporter
VYPQAAARVIAFYEHKLKEVDPESEQAWRKTDYAEKELRLAALDAERRAVWDLASMTTSPTRSRASWYARST